MLLKHHALLRAITRLAGAKNLQRIRRFSRLIYVCLRALEPYGKFRESHWDRSWGRNLLLLTDRRRFRTIAYITPKNIRWGHWVHATFRRVNNRVALRATYEFLCAIRERVEWRSPREFRDYLHTSYRRDIFATGICIRLRAISRSRWRAPEGWNQKWGWLKLHFLPIAVLPSA